VRRFAIPEGLRVLPDGSWRTGELPVVHAESLRFFKTHLLFEDGRAFVVDGKKRMAITLDGPPFVVVKLVCDDARSVARLVLDDGTEQPVSDGSIGMDEETGRFQAAVHGGHAQALFDRTAHQQLLERAIERGGEFFLRVGEKRLALRT
jgi:hypothetical protein